MNSVEFRKELLKVMPSYNWTVHKTADPVVGSHTATGIQSSGFNRLSTLRVTRTEKAGAVWYEVKSAGSGTKSPWACTIGNVTLARALRDLQNHYEWQAGNFRSLAARLEAGRKPVEAQST